MQNKNLAYIVIGLLLIGAGVGILLEDGSMFDEKPVRVCTSERLMKGYAGDVFCYNYYEKEGRLEVIEDS